MGETTYRANCHCGQFVYEITLPEPLSSVYACNCSVCSKKAYLFAWQPEGQDIKVVKGSLDDLATYAFGEKYKHRFCANCGSSVFVEATEPGQRKALNVRCFQGPVDVWALETKTFDGASIPPAYKEPTVTGPEPTAGPAGDKPAEVYHGSCHCGAVRLAVRFQPLDKLDPEEDGDRVIECNCSICQRIGARWIYPATGEQVTVEDPEGQLKHYAFGAKVGQKDFCGKCGVFLTNTPYPITPEELASLPPSDTAASDTAAKWRERMANKANVNTRVLHGVDFDKMPVRHLDGYDIIKPGYVNP